MCRIGDRDALRAAVAAVLGGQVTAGVSGYSIDFPNNAAAAIVQVDPGATLALDDILETFFGTGTGAAIGALEIRPLTSTSTSTSTPSTPTTAQLKTFASTAPSPVASRARGRNSERDLRPSLCVA